MRHRSSNPLLVLSATLLFLTTPAFAQQANSVALPDTEAEIAIGRQAASNLEQNVILIQDSVVAEYVNRVGQTIVRNSDAKVPFTFRVVDSDEISALALPGGFVFVNKGLVLACDSEAELASALAHGVAHVTARHAMAQQQKASLLNIAAIPVIFGGGLAGSLVQQAAAIGLPVSFVSFSQKAEAEADFLGLQYLFKAGYDPTAMVDFFEKLRAREAAGARVSPLFATHPQTEERIKTTRQSIANYAPVRTPAEFETVKARMMGRN